MYKQKSGQRVQHQRKQSKGLSDTDEEFEGSRQIYKEESYHRNQSPSSKHSQTKIAYLQAREARNRSRSKGHDQFS